MEKERSRLLGHGGALFRSYDNWVDGTGVRDMPASAHQASGARMARWGYLPEDPAG